MMETQSKVAIVLCSDFKHKISERIFHVDRRNDNKNIRLQSSMMQYYSKRARSKYKRHTQSQNWFVHYYPCYFNSNRMFGLPNDLYTYLITITQSFPLFFFLWYLFALSFITSHHLHTINYTNLLNRLTNICKTYIAYVSTLNRNRQAFIKNKFN